MQLRTSEDKNDAFRILPLRTGEGELKGILFNTICPDVRKKPLKDTVDLIINRLGLIVPDARPTLATPSRFVYLAECTPDMDDPRDRMRSFLNERGWTVLPAGEYPEDEYQSAPEIIATGFEDFKAHLEKELAVLAQRRNTPPDEDADGGTPPHVVVAIRSANPDPLWDQVFGWIYDQEKIDPSQLMPGAHSVSSRFHPRAGSSSWWINLRNSSPFAGPA
jgi:hypothetical protein